MKKRLPLLIVPVALVVLALQSPSESQAPAASYQVDPVHSSVIFRIQHMGAGNFYGRFNKIEGTFSVKEGGNGSIDVTVDANSVDTAFGDRDKHIKSPDFLNVKQFPAISFKSDDFKAAGGSEYTAKGTLTLHGVSKEVTAKIAFTGKGKGKQGEIVGFETHLTIQRTDYGMNNMVGMLSDEIKLIIAVEGVKQ